MARRPDAWPRAPRWLGESMGTLEGLRIIATLIGGGFLIYAVLAVFRGTCTTWTRDASTRRPAPSPSGSRWLG
jgi:hypothetical protein